jgi:hypothetical protein
MPAHLKRATLGARFLRNSAATTIGDSEKYHHGHDLWHRPQSSCALAKAHSFSFQALQARSPENYVTFRWRRAFRLD